MIINKHYLEYPRGVYQLPYCKHCGVTFESDLGWTSFDNLKCIDREAESISEWPEEVRSFIIFNGLAWNEKKTKLVKAYSDKSYTVKQLFETVKKLKA